MNSNVKKWKEDADQLWAEATLDYRGATQLSAEIARSEDSALRAVAAQALPSLRAALLETAVGGHACGLARRRFGAVRNLLHVLGAPRFGKRGADELNPDEQNRRLLGLPSGRRLYRPEIHQAYKRAAKTRHPDAGGSERAFQELSAARDALLKDG